MIIALSLRAERGPWLVAAVGGALAMPPRLSVLPLTFGGILMHGPGITQKMPAGLFRKFSHGATARAGSLGRDFSIVQGLMREQRGGVTAGTNPEGEALFTLHPPHGAHSVAPDDEG